MSIKTRICHRVRTILAERRASHGTRSAKLSFARGLSDHMARLQRVDRARPPTLDEICRYLESKVTTLSKRSMQNHLCHARQLASALSYGEDVVKQRLSCSPWNVAGASRTGTGVPVSLEAFREQLDRIRSKSEGLAHCYELQRLLGLRAREAVMAGQDVARWRLEIQAGRPISILHGTKGGRERDTFVPDCLRDLALDALDRALRFLGHRTRFLPGDLDEQLTYHRNTLSRLGIKSHGGRHGFARDHVDGRLASGMDKRAARASTAMSLGHGSGRGRYIKSVYYRDDAQPVRGGPRCAAESDASSP